MLKIRVKVRARTLVLVALVACGGGGSTDVDAPGGGTDAAADAASVSTRTVTGMYNVRRVTTSGEVVVPEDLSMATIKAIVPPMFTTISGTGTAQGTFTIPDVPVGTFYLRVNDWYIVTSTDTIDLSYDRLGHVAPAVTSATPLTFNVTNLSAWQTTDDLEMFSTGNGLAAFAMESLATAGTPAANATSLAGFVFDLSRSAYRPQIDGAAGDVVSLTQLKSATAGALTYTALARKFDAPSFTVANGGSATIAGAFVDVAQSANLAATFDRPAFDAALRAQLPGDSTTTYPVLALQALPEAATRGLYHSAPDLVSFEPGYVADSSSITTAWPYGDPYPVAWTRVITARYFTYHYVPVGAGQLALFASLEVDRSLAAPGSVVPLIGPVVSPKVNGLDAYGTLTGVGITPTVSWSAPAIGTASRYYVRVMRVVPGTIPTRTVALVIETSATSVQIPPGIIMSGESYTFDVSARAAPGVDLAATPGRLSLPNAYSRIASAIATP